MKTIRAARTSGHLRERVMRLVFLIAACVSILCVALICFTFF